MACEKCGYEVQVGDFPFCKGRQEDHKGCSNVIGDECDVLMRNGLCHADGSPKRYTSKEAIRRDEQKAGLTNYVVHRGTRGSDKSPHTTRWY